MEIFNEPSESNHYLAEHVQRLLSSLRRWTGRSLIDTTLPIEQQARSLFDAPFAVLSHNTADDPLLNYANRAGLRLFELTWRELIQLPSRATAEPIHQEARARLLARVSVHGFIDDYQGVRISKSGRRFEIERATVWNLVDEKGEPYGQAATFGRWRYLESSMLLEECGTNSRIDRNALDRVALEVRTTARLFPRPRIGNAHAFLVHAHGIVTQNGGVQVFHIHSGIAGLIFYAGRIVGSQGSRTAKSN